MRRTLLLGLGFCLAVALLLAAYAAAPRSITIQIDGYERTVRTRAATVAHALAEAGVWLDPDDTVQPALDARLDPGVLIVIHRAPLLSITANGDTTVLRQEAATGAEALGLVGLSLGPGDVLWAGGQPIDEPAAQPLAAHHVSLQRAVPVVIEDSAGGRLETRSAARTVGEALWALDYALYVGDDVQPPLDTPLTPGLVVTVTRSQPVRIEADGQALTGRTRAATVGEAVSDLGVALLGEDYTVPAEHEPLPADGRIQVVRVREEIITEQELIPYETTYQPMPDVEIDNVYPLQAGQPGVIRRLTRVRYENGVEVGRVTEGEVLVQEARPLVIGYGTQIVIRTLDTPDGPIEYWRAYEMYATSYAAKFTGRTPGTPAYGRTASGKYVTKGIVAIDRSMMPFGTRMYVPGYGFAEAADTGGGVRGRFIDLGYDDHNYVGWHKVVMVYFLTPVPPASAIRWIIPSTVP